MILELFIALLALSGFVVFLGYYTDDEPYLTVGLVILFFLGIVIITGSLQYETGVTATNTFSTNNGTITNSTTTLTYTQQSWDDTTSHYVGYFICIASVLGVALHLYQMKRKGATDG